MESTTGNGYVSWTTVQVDKMVSLPVSSSRALDRADRGLDRERWRNKNNTELLSTAFQMKTKEREKELKRLTDEVKWRQAYQHACNLHKFQRYDKQQTPFRFKHTDNRNLVHSKSEYISNVSPVQLDEKIDTRINRFYFHKETSNIENISKQKTSENRINRRRTRLPEMVQKPNIYRPANAVIRSVGNMRSLLDNETRRILKENESTELRKRITCQLLNTMVTPDIVRRERTTSAIYRHFRQFRGASEP